jgi:hypothetical protein
MSIFGTQKPFKLNIKVFDSPEEAYKVFPVKVSVINSTPTFAPERIVADYDLLINPIQIPLRFGIIDSINKKIDGKIENFYDDRRVLKTLVNLGNDDQLLLTNWGLDATDPRKTTIVAKLYRPLPNTVNTNIDAWIVRQLSQDYIDLIKLYELPPETTTTLLRSRNLDIKVKEVDGVQISDKKWTDLLPVTSSQQILEEWFVTSLEGAELNIDYSSYPNFVHFGSAAARLEAFRNKLLLLEYLTNQYNITSASFTSSLNNNSVTYNTLRNIENERLSIIRSFDGYERYLYYEVSSSYSSSFSKDPDDEVFVNSYINWPYGTWPKIGNSLAAVTSSIAREWFDVQYSIAEEYDKWNQNSLVNNLPEYIQRDYKSHSFIKLIQMVGHQFDTIKLYIDAMSYLYNRENDPSVGLSKDIIWNVAESFGAGLSNQYSVKNLLDYVIGDDSTSKVYRDISSEVWKRYLHNHLYLSKARGTRSGLQSLLNIFGISPNTLTVTEFGVTPDSFDSFKPYENYIEFTNVLNVNSYLQIPWSSVPLVKNTLEMRFSTTGSVEQVLLQGSSSWALTAVPTLTGSEGYFAFKTGSNLTVATSSVFTNLFDGTYHTVQLMSASAGIVMRAARNRGDVILESSYITASAGSNVWNTPNFVYIGAPGFTYGTPFVGLLDEFRLWGEESSTSYFENAVRYPAIYSGNTTGSAYNKLWIRLSFNSPTNLGGGSNEFVLNESPSPSASFYPVISGSGFGNQGTYPYNFKVVSRESIRFSPVGAGTVGNDNKVHIIGNEFTPTDQLSRNFSIISRNESRKNSTSDSNLVGLYYSLSKTINDSIIRSIGNVNISDLIGDPQDIYDNKYDDLASLNKFYWTYYAYTYNLNKTIDATKNLFRAVFEQAKQFVSARTTLLTGFVIEPHILERNKITPFTQPKVAGGGLNRIEEDKGAYNLTAEPIYSSPVEVQSSFELLTTEIDTSEELYVSALDNTLSTTLTTSNVYEIESTPLDLTTTIELDSTYQIDTSYPFYSSNIDINQDYVLLAKLKIQDFNSGSNYLDKLLIVNPVSDFNDPGSYIYFTHPLGYVGIKSFTRIPKRSSTLVNRGTWVRGDIYSVNEYVLDPTNNKEYYVQNNRLFISNLEPSLDPSNWRPVPYINVETKQILKAIEVNGIFTLAPTSSLETGFVGYRDNHFIFTRDYHTGTLRHQHLGCVQTINTTIDGKPPVEVIRSAGDTLVVRNSAEPIQPTDNTSGPILEVQ